MRYSKHGQEWLYSNILPVDPCVFAACIAAISQSVAEQKRTKSPLPVSSSSLGWALSECSLVSTLLGQTFNPDKYFALLKIFSSMYSESYSPLPLLQ